MLVDAFGYIKGSGALINQHVVLTGARNFEGYVGKRVATREGIRQGPTFSSFGWFKQCLFRTWVNIYIQCHVRKHKAFVKDISCQSHFKFWLYVDGDCAVTAQLICAFVFVCENPVFSCRCGSNKANAFQ